MIVIIQHNVLVGHLDAKEMDYNDVGVSHNFSMYLTQIKTLMCIQHLMLDPNKRGMVRLKWRAEGLEAAGRARLSNQYQHMMS